MTLIDLDQRIADWHEGRAGTDQELHEYLGMTWAEYSAWLNQLTRSAAMTPEDDAFNRGLDKMPVTGTCDAGCGKPATEWFGDTACATCGDRACVNVMQDSYDREGERPAGVRLHSALATAQDRIRDLEDAVRENHEWHQMYDEYGYRGSALEQTNRAALGLPPLKDPNTVGGVCTRRLEEQLLDYQAILATGTIELDMVLLSAALCTGSILELRKSGLFTAQEAQLWRQHVRALFTAHRPDDLDRFNAAMAQREPKEDPQ